MKIRPGRRPGAAKPGARVTTLLTSPGRDRAAANPPPKPGGPRAPGGPLREAGARPACARPAYRARPASSVSRVWATSWTWWPRTTVLRPFCNACNPHVRFGPGCRPHAGGWHISGKYGRFRDQPPRDGGRAGVGHVPSVYRTLRDQPPSRPGSPARGRGARVYTPKDFERLLRPDGSRPKTPSPPDTRLQHKVECVALHRLPGKPQQQASGRMRSALASPRPLTGRSARPG
jgi:hypothetical protein